MIYHILLKPDSFWKNCYEKIIVDLVSIYQIKLIDWNLIIPSEELLDQMYFYNFKWEFDYYNLNRKLYSLGPCLSLVAEIKDSLDIRKIKGAALPKEYQHNSIRSSYHVKDRNINLIHIADDIKESIKELSIIFQCEFKNDVTKDYKEQSEMIHEIKKCAGFGNEISARSVLNLLLVRIHQKIFSTLNVIWGITDRDRNLNFMLVPENERKKIIYPVIALYELYHSIKADEKSIRNIKFLEYFLYVCKKNLIYISQIEEYVLLSDAAYQNVNLW